MKQQQKMFAELNESINDLSRNVKFHNKQYEDVRNDENLIRFDVNMILRNDITKLKTTYNKLSAELHHVTL